jgi:hypothetical protein
MKKARFEVEVDLALVFLFYISNPGLILEYYFLIRLSDYKLEIENTNPKQPTTSTEQARFIYLL